MKKQLLCVFSVLFSLLLLAGCGAGSDGTPVAANSAAAAYEDYDGYSGEEMAPTEAGGTAASPESPGISLPQDGRKVILNADLSVEATDFDAACRAIEAAMKESGGYIAASSYGDNSGYASSRSAHFTVRVPAENYSGFLSRMSEAGQVVSRNEYSEDITSTYVDLEARLGSLRAQETRLLELMGQAGDLADLIALEDKLAEVQYEIESYTAQKNTYDQLVAYSTVEISLWEVVELSPVPAETYGERVGRAFSESWANFANFWRECGILLVYALPALLVMAAVAVVVILLVVRSNRHKKNRRQTPSAPISGFAPAAGQPPASAPPPSSQAPPTGPSTPSGPTGPSSPPPSSGGPG